MVKEHNQERLLAKLDQELLTKTNVIGQARNQFRNHAHLHVQSGFPMVGQVVQFLVAVENGPDCITAN